MRGQGPESEYGVGVSIFAYGVLLLCILDVAGKRARMS